MIERELASGRGVREIARLLGRNHSVISRELQPDRDQGLLPYSAKRAQLRAERLAGHGRKRKLDKDRELRTFVVEKLTDDWSPEQIAGYLRERKDSQLSVETIYQFVYSGERALDSKLLYRHLRRAQPKRVRRYNRRTSKTLIPDRISIHQRPVLSGYGHWESDTIFARRNQPASVQHEKTSGLILVTKLTSLKAEETAQTIAARLAELPAGWQKTVTFDNGTENTRHTELNKLGIQTFFCDPYKPYQKGAVENTNGLLRQYIPKKANLSNYTDQQIYRIQEKLNNRPRKRLEYKTPNEILKLQSGALVSRT